MIASFPAGDLRGAAWIDLLSPTAPEIAQVSAATGLDVPSEEEVSEIESTSRLGFDKGAYYLSTPLVAVRPGGEHVMTSAGFVLSPKVLITVRFAPIPAFDTAQLQPASTAEGAFLQILEVIVDRAADVLERTGSDCDDLSHQAFGRERRDLRETLRKLGAVADRSSHIRDALLGLGRIAAYIAEGGVAGAPPVNPARMKAIRTDVASLTEYQSHLSGKIQFLLDATLGFINVEQNDVVKTLTIASVVGIPPVLIAGIYGMNFRVMPELGWKYGYPMALGLMVASGLLPLLWFKRRGWMD
jgi:magnesium transporter